MTNELAIRILTGDVLCTNEQTQEAVTMAVKALSMSAIQLEHRWILCSERLPEPTPEYEILCCDTRGSCLVAIPFADEGSDTGYSAESDGCYMYNCIAWMPLLISYKKG